MIDQYDAQLSARLYAGEIDECFRFLDERAAEDQHLAEYWHWRAVTHLRGGEFKEALEICCRLTRESDRFAYQMHCLSDVCAHLGLKEVALAMIEYYAHKASTVPIGAFLWRVYGWHYLGEDERVLQLSAEGVGEHSAYVLGHHQGRSAMRLNGIASGVELMHRYWSSRESRRVLFPHVDVEHYWCGERVLPAHMTLTSIASGHGDQVNWVRYAGGASGAGRADRVRRRLRSQLSPRDARGRTAKRRRGHARRGLRRGARWRAVDRSLRPLHFALSGARLRALDALHRTGRCRYRRCLRR